MKFKFSDSMAPIKLGVLKATEESEKRHLKLYDEIKCKKNCHGCCSRFLEISIAEGIIIYDYLKQKNLWEEVRKVATEQAPLIQKITGVSWFLMNKKCPVLDEKTGLCRAYKVRPVACSVHFSISNPELCNPWSVKTGEEEILVFQDIYDKFYDKLNNIGKGILSFTTPLPLALLLAERINAQTGLTMEQTISMFYNEL